MVHCATQRKAGLVIVTRDTDYGITIEKESYINDALRQEFSERVSRKRPLRLYSLLSDALKAFDVEVTEQEEASEAELVSSNRYLRQAKDLSPGQLAYQNFRGASTGVITVWNDAIGHGLVTEDGDGVHGVLGQNCTSRLLAKLAGKAIPPDSQPVRFDVAVDNQAINVDG